MKRDVKGIVREMTLEEKAGPSFSFNTIIL